MDTNTKLAELVDNKTIKSYSFNTVSENGEVDKKSQCGNTERLTINFNNGEKLVIDTFCSGCDQNTIIFVS